VSRWARGALLAACALGLALPGYARADGDPASDFLLVQPVFVSYTRPSQPQIDRLTKTVAAAKRGGYTIRVAVIAARTDLGSVPQEFGRPKAYAAFLDAELQSAYRGRLLVAMPQGYGFRVGTKADPAADRVLASLPRPASGSSDDLTAAATVAVRALASAAGVEVPVIPLEQAGSRASGGESSHTVLLIAGGALLLAAVVAAILFWPGRHAADD
jgi:hypothetical protein